MKVKLETKVRRLAQLTRQQYRDIENIGVLGGQAGTALFQFYCAQYFDDDAYAETGVEIISSCIEKVNKGYSFPSYCNGIAGFGWTLQHLVDNNFVDLDLDELLTPFDEFLFDQMNSDFNNGYYDMLHGGMGYGFYFLKRFESLHTSSKEKEKYHAYLIKLLDFLEEMAIKDGDCLKWESILNQKKGNKGFNLSLSHGISSIVFLLSKIHDANIKKDRVATLIKGGVNYLKSHEKTDKLGISLFPSWIQSNAPLEYQSRLAWCYGDIGIAKAFEWAGKSLEDCELINEAQEILVHASKRQIKEESLVMDSGFCHGSFGNAHMFYQIGLGNKEEHFKKVANFWMKDGLSKETGNIEEPYKQWDGQTKSWRFELNLLEGISGIGLVMIDFLSKKENTWDECLMLR